MSALDSVCLSGCLSFTLLRIASSFFVSRWNRAILWPSVLHDPLYKTLFFDFRFRPPNDQNLLHKICTKSPITRLLRQIDRRCLAYWGGRRGGGWGVPGWPIQWNHVKCCGADPCCRGNEILANLGYFAQNRLYVGLYGR